MYVVCSAHICQGLRGWAGAVGGIVGTGGTRKTEERSGELKRKGVCVCFFRTPAATEKPNTLCLLRKNYSYRMMLLSLAAPPPPPPFASLCLSLDQRADINRLKNLQTQTRETHSYKHVHKSTCAITGLQKRQKNMSGNP